MLKEYFKMYKHRKFTKIYFQNDIKLKSIKQQKFNIDKVVTFENNHMLPIVSFGALRC